MNILKLRKGLLWSFIIFLSITALIAIVTVLSGEFGETQLKVLGTTFAISAASICAMSCAAFIGKNGRNIFGFAGIVFAVASSAMSIIGMWAELNGATYWKTTGVLIISAVSIAYALLLLIPSLADNHRWTQTTTVICIGILAIELIAAVCAEIDNTGYYRFVAVTSIVTVLMTLVVPICAKLHGKESEDHHDQLLLRKISDDIYTDQSARKFRVTEIKS